MNSQLIFNLQDEEDLEKTEGFWLEFFLLKPNKGELQRILGELKVTDLLHIPVCAELDK